MLFHEKYALWWRWRFLNLSISQKWLVTQTIWPIVAAGQNLKNFAEKKLALNMKTFKLIFSYNTDSIFFLKEIEKLP